jgi:hypothetical protein
VYFYKLVASDPETSSGLNFTETKKLILLKWENSGINKNNYIIYLNLFSLIIKLF